MNSTKKTDIKREKPSFHYRKHKALKNLEFNIKLELNISQRKKIRNEINFEQKISTFINFIETEFFIFAILTAHKNSNLSSFALVFVPLRVCRKTQNLKGIPFLIF